MGLSNVGRLMSKPVKHDANDLEDEPEPELDAGRENRYRCHPSRSEPKTMMNVGIIRKTGQRGRFFRAGVEPITHVSVALRCHQN